MALLLCHMLAAQQMKQSSWQQQVDYVINVSLDDNQHVLSAFEVISYHNNSPHTLNEIYFHLWPNAYLNNETPFARQQVENGSTDFYYAPEEERGRIDSLLFRVDGESVRWEFPGKQYEIAKIMLNKPLRPGQSVKISTPFRVKLPKVFSRLGHEGQMYCITQWYPKPAVYDVNGWNTMPYLDQGEFYSEFGSFDVSITVPANYLVAATGNLRNADELEKLRNISASRFSRGSACDKNDVPASSSKTKTLRFTEDHIHDFAWFADKRFSVERSEVTLPNGHKVSTWLYEVCPKASAVHYLDTAILFYSEKVGNYPYNHVTAVVTPIKAGAGMEYPTITNIDKASRQVIVHEVGHNWFYGMLGSNERAYPWMDEGINNYYESRSTFRPKVTENPSLFGRNKKGLDLEHLTESSFAMLEQEYLLSARTNTDQLVFLPAGEFTFLNYGTIVYGKAALAFHQLQAYLGDEVFDGMMRSYFEKWRFRHPLPQDFTDHVKAFTGKDLDWFFNGLLNTREKPDYAISRVKRDGDRLLVTLKNRGGVASPVMLQTLDNGVIIDEALIEGFGRDTTVSMPLKHATLIRIDAKEQGIDVWRANNYARTGGLFKTVRPVEFRLLLDLEKPQKQQVFYTPVIGANLYNKTMLGLAFYNSLLPRKRTEYAFVPLYSFGTKDLAGYASLQRRFMPKGKVFREISIGVDYARFAMHGDNPALFYDSLGNVNEGVDLDNKLRVYEKLAPRIRFEFAKADPRTDADKSITFRYTMVHEQKFTRALFNNFGRHYAYLDAEYAHEQTRAVNPYSVFIRYQSGQAQSSFQKLTIEYNTFIDYGEKKKGLAIRAFAGAFIRKPAEGMDERVYFRGAENNGYYADYTYSESQFGRGNSETMFSQQIMPNTSGFRTYVSIGSTDSWLASASFTSTIPGILPIRPFVDVMIINTKHYHFDGNTGVTDISYEATPHFVAGISLWLIKDAFQVNFPVFADKITTDNWNNFYHSYGQRMSFTLRLNKLNPVKLIREIKIM